MNSVRLIKASVLIALITTSTQLIAQLNAQFSANPTSGCSPLVVRFTDQSSGNPTQWRWDLGNGTISFLQNPSATYFAPGKYTIKLVARNASSIDSVIKVEYIEVSAKPGIDFSASTTTGCFPLAVNFNDLSNAGSGTITSWVWDFGDGTTSTLQNPSHIYTSARNFNVTLQVRNSSGCVSTLTKNSLIQISSGALADFTNNNPQTCKAPVIIDFQNQSTGTGAVTYEWDFGDGNTSTLINPSHSYSTNGTYSVKLVVTSSNGCIDTIIKENAVTVGSVDAMFTAPSGTICEGTNLQFTNTSVPTPASATWYFGDGNSSTSMNATHIYNSSGNFIVKMVANFGACTDSATRNITVQAKPAAAFTSSDTADCKAPFTVNFINQSMNATSYVWYFGDGDTSSSQNPTHTYNTAGNFTVKLVTINANGCLDSVIQSNYISIVRPIATIENVPDSGCVPFTKTFDVSLNITEPVSNYTWNFGDGNTSTAASPTHTYTTQGNYNISVIITTLSGCTDTATRIGGVVTNTKPIVNFSATPTISCAKNPITFTNQSTGGGTRWLWEFGDSTRSTLQNPIHQYQDTGYFDIKLKVWNGGCMDSLFIPRYIQINPPIALFAINVDCKKPFERTFTDQSIGAEEWHWDFGDGTTSTLRNPSHTYAANGQYTVTLRVVNNTFGCDYTTTKEVKIIDTRAQFSTADTSVCKGDNITFTTGISLTVFNSLNWNFGDGTSSINSGFQMTTMDHIFTRTGQFTVRLILTDKNGCQDTMIKTRYITVGGPTAKFAPSNPGACLNSMVVFNDSTMGTSPIQQWQWQYGNGVTETLTSAPFQHLYTSPGSYIVKLKVTDTEGCTDSTSLSTALIISSPKANFTTLDTISCPGKPIRFVNQSAGNNLAYRWEFGDNTSSSSANPAHFYISDGIFTIKLVISDPYGCTDSITRINYVTIKSPVAAFTISDSASNCPPLIVRFTNHSTNAKSLRWDFGDSTYSTETNPSHFYYYPGIYFTKLFVTGAGGCIDTFERKITIKGPEGSFTYAPLKGCNPLTVNFSATTNGRNTIVWDFNDGTTVTTSDTIISHTYTYPGNYVPKMILIDQTGCQVPITGHDSITVSSIFNNFSFNNKALCDSGMVSFSDSTIITYGDAVTSYQWNFGDGNVSGSQHPVHHYNQPGIYYPELITVSQLGCSDTLRSAIPLKIVASPKVNILSTGNGCSPLTVTFNSQLTAPDTSAINWQWNFANGNTSMSANPAAQQYSNAGLYTVILSGTNSTGCTSSDSATIEAYAIPVVSAGSNFILCKGSTKVIEATGADTYNWSPSTGLNCTNCATPVTSTSNNITYTVTGTSAQGCSAIDSVTVTIKEKLTITYSGNDSVCAGSSKKLFATGANSYAWSPTNGLDNPNSNEPTATPASTTTYMIVGSDDVGCFKDTGYVAIKVNPIPTVEAGADKTINVGQTVDLVPVISPDVTNVTWQPTTGLFRNFYPGISVKPNENTEYTVQVKNNGGCAARDRVTVFVICNGSNIFIPNTFSPNADGTNDVFYPRGTGLFKIKSLRIFTRWGEIVFEKRNFDANNAAYGWDGTSKGQRANPDVFVYTLEVICDNGSVLTYRGNISLVK